MLVSLTMTELFRICGNLAHTYFAANQMANIVLVVLLGYVGFLVPYEYMHGWVCSAFRFFINYYLFIFLY